MLLKILGNDFGNIIMTFVLLNCRGRDGRRVERQRQKQRGGGKRVSVRAGWGRREEGGISYL